MIEDRDWENTIEFNTIESYNTFITLYPKSKRNEIGFPEGSLERIILINLYDSFSISRNSNLLMGNPFILNYPEDCFICDVIVFLNLKIIY